MFRFWFFFFSPPPCRASRAGQEVSHVYQANDSRDVCSTAAAFCFSFCCRPPSHPYLLSPQLPQLPHHLLLLLHPLLLGLFVLRRWRRATTRHKCAHDTASSHIKRTHTHTHTQRPHTHPVHTHTSYMAYSTRQQNHKGKENIEFTARNANFCHRVCSMANGTLNGMLDAQDTH